MSKEYQQLEDNPIWKEANSLAEYIYKKLPEFPDEEEWNTVSKLRNNANDLIFAVAQAVGSDLNPSGAEYEWGSVRKHIFSLKTMYRFASKQKFIELEPEIMVRLNSLLSFVNSEIDLARKKTANHDKKELEPWLKKYKLWKEMQK